MRLVYNTGGETARQTACYLDCDCLSDTAAAAAAAAAATDVNDRLDSIDPQIQSLAPNPRAVAVSLYS